MELLVLLFAIAVYFLPSIIAFFTEHDNAVAIFVVNLLLGWTFLGWVVALAWSVKR